MSTIVADIDRRTSSNNWVLQPTQICNMNCTYCYLPDRLAKKHMSVEVAAAVAQGIADLNQDGGMVLWHSGEPLVIGTTRFRKLLEPFETLRKAGHIHHSIQTNGTLIDDEWCNLFREFEFSVGVSLDGPEELNHNRVDWQGKPTFAATVRGIRKLQEHQIVMSILAVVSTANVHSPRAFYEFFKELGCKTLAINVHEQEGLVRGNETFDEQYARRFWKMLFRIWNADRSISIREFDRAIQSLQKFNQDHAAIAEPVYELWPTVSWNGDVVVAAPELASAKPEELTRFVIGNVLSSSAKRIIAQAQDSWYVREMFEGISMCKATCPYFFHCKGGQCSNKYFERGVFAVTETHYCRTHQMAVIDAVLDCLEETV